MALGWVAANWSGLLAEVERVLGDVGVDILDPDLDDAAILDATVELARSRPNLAVDPLFGRLPRRHAAAARARREPAKELRADAVDVQGAGPSSHPLDPGGRRRGSPRPEPAAPEPTRGRRHRRPVRRTSRHSVSGVERVARGVPAEPCGGARAPARHRTSRDRLRCRRRSGGGSRNAPIGWSATVWTTGPTSTSTATSTTSSTWPPDTTHEPRVFRDLVPGVRDVTTALLLDGSSSLGAHGGRVFELELACADALSQAMTLSKERHGIFTFTGNTRHRVDVRCLKDFDQATLRRPEQRRPRHRRLHPPRCPDPPPHRPPARASRRNGGC